MAVDVLLLVIVMTYVGFVPTVTGSREPVFTISRSADGMLRLNTARASSSRPEV